MDEEQGEGVCEEQPLHSAYVIFNSSPWGPDRPFWPLWACISCTDMETKHPYTYNNTHMYVTSKAEPFVLGESVLIQVSKEPANKMVWTKCIILVI